MTPPLSLELIAAVSGAGTTAILAYVGRELRGISDTLALIPVHERTLFGTEHAPGLVERIHQIEERRK